MRLNFLTSALLLALTLTTSCKEKETMPTPKEIALEQLAIASRNQRPMLGHQDDPFYGKNWCSWQPDMPGESDIKAVTGRYPAVLGVEIGALELGREASIDRVDFNRMREAIQAHHRMGGLITMSWHPAHPITGGNSWDTSTEGGIRALVKGGSHHETFQSWMGNLCDFIQTLKDDNGNQIPIIWRPWHENSGSWFWWGARWNKPEEYIELWKQTYRFFDNRGLADQLIWAYSPSFHSDSPDGYNLYWPGDKWVDLVGADIYQYAPDEEFIRSTRQQLKELEAFAREHNKLIALTETGVEAIPNPQWWSQVLSPAIEGAPIAYLLLWRNAWDRPNHYYAPFPGEHSVADFRNFLRKHKMRLIMENKPQK